MEIIQENTATTGHFETIDKNGQAGLLTYHWETPQKLVIEHTEVNPAFSGRGVGLELVMAVVDYARAQQVKIVPLCPYAKKVFQKDHSIRDLLFKERLGAGPKKE